MPIDESRVAHLSDYVRGVLAKADGKSLYQQYQEELEQVSPQEAVEVFYRIYEEGLPTKDILNILDKVINVFYKGLNQHQWQLPVKAEFLQVLMQENDGLTSRLKLMKELFLASDNPQIRDRLKEAVVQLITFDKHYLKKEYLLFPYLEKETPRFKGLAIMWALHDDIRRRWKLVLSLLEERSTPWGTLSREAGQLVFYMHGLVLKERLILFPAAVETLKGESWEALHKQSFEYGFPFIEAPQPQALGESLTQISTLGTDLTLKTETGILTVEQVFSILNVLPVDITFVDEKDEVRYFSRPKDRFFPRSPAIIGRNVENCHPPDSVHVVKEILESFRAGKQDQARFWIDLKGKKLLIQYFAIKDEQGNYRGTLEVSQDISEIQKLEGQRRLLEWREDEV